MRLIRTATFVALVTALLAATVVGNFGALRQAPLSVAAASRPAVRVPMTAVKNVGLYTIYEREGGLGCRAASNLEQQVFLDRSSRERLHRLSPLRPAAEPEQEGGLQIILRGTAQLEEFPEAKATFLRAAEIWKARIHAPITIIIDVDFGPERFGKKYPSGVLGSTSPQLVGGNKLYPAVREALIEGASNDQEASIYNLLPSQSVPTDRGNTTYMIGPTSVFRALGLLEPVADPAAEEDDFGDPPNIGFNSAFQYDFNPDDGIAPNLLDFEAIAVHELGHALGFSSMVGLLDADSDSDLAVSVWDLFRVRPNTPADAFSTAPRIMSLGGSQSECAAESEVSLSTGGFNGNGGDGEQSSHWKDDAFTGSTIGIMDPTQGSGDREVISSHDLLALDLMGYSLKGNFNIAPEAGNFRVIGNVLNQTLALNGGGVDPDADITSAEIQLFNTAGASLGTTSIPVTNLLNSTVTGLNLQIPGVTQLTGVRRAGLVLIDSQGNRSRLARADVLLDGDPNRPTLSTLTYNGKKMKIKGNGFAGQFRLEVNGVIVASTSASGKKIVIVGKPENLNIKTGSNQIRVIVDNRRSDVFSLTR